MTPRYHVILSPRAAGDLHAVHTFVERDSPQNAASLIGELVDAIDSLQFLPHRYRVYRGSRQPAEAVRRMPVPPFLIYYRVDDRRLGVDVITVRHGKQRQPRRFGR